MPASKRAADFAPNRQDLNPIEVASRDEIAALQLRRMKWSLKHAYENVPHYKKSFDAAGAHPDDLKQLSDLGKFPLTGKDDSLAVTDDDTGAPAPARPRRGAPPPPPEPEPDLEIDEDFLRRIREV